MNDEIIELQDCRNNWFICVDIAVISDNKLSPLAKHVFTVLCMIAGFGYRSCKVSDDYVASVSGITVPELSHAYKELEDRGVIDREPYLDTITDEVLFDIWLIGYHAPCYGKEEEA